MSIQCAQGGHDDEVGQDEGPTPRPCSPEPSPQIGNVDPDLDGEGPWQRLAHGDSVAEFVFRQPLSFFDQFFFHLPAERDWSSKTERPEAEVIAHQVSDPHSGNTVVSLHTSPSPVCSTTTACRNFQSLDHQS